MKLQACQRDQHGLFVLVMLAVLYLQSSLGVLQRTSQRTTALIPLLPSMLKDHPNQCSGAAGKKVAGCMQLNVCNFS